LADASAIIVAAGRSRRMGFDKLFAEVAGRPVLAWSVAAFEQCAAIARIVIVGPEDGTDALEELRAREGWRKVERIVAGGAERHLSVARGLEALGGSDTDLVAIHDGARPLVSAELIARCLAKAAEMGAVCCAAPVADTMKRATPDLMVSGSVDRDGLWAMQTPQVFRRDLIRRAYAAILASDEKVSDEVSAVQRLGKPVALLLHEEWNFKITYPRDLKLASHLLKERAGASSAVSS